MTLDEIEKQLKLSLDDFKLDNEEKKLFKNLAEAIRPDQQNFIRNKAFEISREIIRCGGEDAVRTLNWLANIIKAIQPNETEQPESQAYFSPSETCRNKIIQLIKRAKSSIKICLFTISDNQITEAILAAHKNNIMVTIISDNDKSNDKGSDIDYLSEQGIKVILDKTRHHMHHKFAIFDEAILLNGSFNWTRSATEFNQENIVVSYERNLIEQFNDKFNSLKQELR
jgi:phosphatidylserine/phosphatidylglycerophosphate/cardiolipin synthase-like enzyme